MSFYYNGNGTGGEWGMGNGEWRMENGDWGMGGLTAGRGTVFLKEVIDLRLSDFRLWTAWTSCITPAFPLSCEAGKEGNAAANQQNAHHAK